MKKIFNKIVAIVATTVLMGTCLIGCGSSSSDIELI